MVHKILDNGFQKITRSQNLRKLANSQLRDQSDYDVTAIGSNSEVRGSNASDDKL